MTNKFFLLLTCFFILTNCSLDNDNIIEDQQEYDLEWHLIEVTGGFTGVDLQFDLDTIIGVFDNGGDNNDADNDNILTIVNNNTDDTKEDFLDSGTYSYSITQETNGNYITIEGTEFGEVTFPTTTTLLIDTNELSTGSGADGFVYTFQRVLVPID